MSSQRPPPPPNKSVQYASSTPSISDILNLPTVGEKKKPGMASGLAATGKPKTVVGGLMKLGPTKSSMTLGLKKPPTIATANYASNTDNSTLTLKPPPQQQQQQPKESQLQQTSTNGSINTVAVPSKPNPIVHGGAKVEKPAAQSKQQLKKKQQQQQQKPPSQASSSTTDIHDHFDPTHWRLFVGNLGPEVSEGLLLNSFITGYPSTSRVLIVKDWKTQKSKGYGFVAFADGREFLRALKEMNGKWIGNRQCIIKKSEHQPNLNSSGVINK